MNAIINSIFRNPPVLLALISAIGLILQRKKIADVIKGSILAAVGMVILDAGVGMLVGSIVPINNAVGSLSASGSAAQGLSDVTFLADYGGFVGTAMLVGMIIHVLIARFTPIKTIFLTGHMLWWFPVVFVAAGVEGGIENKIILVAFAAIASALYWSIMPWIMRKYVSDATGDDSFTLGHPAGFIAMLSGFVASKVGDKSKSTEDINIPEGLSFFREISITGGIVILIMYIVIGLFVPSLVMEGETLVMLAIKQGLAFGAGLTIMLSGVRLLINQIIPAFKGISEKLVPNALPAFDCPIIFNYKPNAVIIGFMVAMVTSTIIIVICNTFNVFGIMVIPLVITSFFECGTAAVFGEGQGGLKGAIIGTVVAAIAMVLLVGISAVIFSGTLQNWLLIFGGNDFSVFGVIAKFIAELITSVTGMFA